MNLILTPNLTLHVLMKELYLNDLVCETRTFQSRNMTVRIRTSLLLQIIFNYTEKMQNVVFALSLFIYFAGLFDVPNMYCLEVRCMQSLLKFLLYNFNSKNLIHSIHRNLSETWYLQDLISFCCFNEETDQFFYSRKRNMDIGCRYK